MKTNWLTVKMTKKDMSNLDLNEVKKMMYEQHVAIERKHKNLKEEAERISGFKRALDAMDDVFKEKERLRAECDSLLVQLRDERMIRRKMEMQMNEMSKLSMSVAGKASQEELLKALRVFVNTSKRKKIEKRIAVKEMVLELANANMLMLPADLAATIDSLDDELPEPRVVNVAGNYNDIHDNGNVKLDHQRPDGR